EDGIRDYKVTGVQTCALPIFERFREHGKVRLSIEDQLSEAKAQLAELADVGIRYDQVTRQLQDEGVQKFADSFHTLFQCIDNKKIGRASCRERVEKTKGPRST